MKFASSVRTIVATALACSLAFGLAACDGSNGLTGNNEATTQVEQLPLRDSAPNPRELTGLSTAQAVGDIEPVAENPQPQLPVKFSDAAGKDVEITDVSRILALDLYGTLSRTVEGIGLGKNLVGRGISSEEPAIADLPVVTEGGHEINAEAVLSLKPTVVLVDESVGPKEAIEQIRNAGVSVAVLDPQRTPDSLENDAMLVSAALGLRAEGEMLGKRSREQMDQAREQIAALAPEGEDRLRMVFLYVRGNGGVFFILGKGSGADTTIEALGGKDVATEGGIVDVKPANAEALAKLNPEVILVMDKGLDSAGGLDGLLARPGVAQTAAGRKPRVVALPDSEAISMGPQAGLSLVRAARVVYVGDQQ